MNRILAALRAFSLLAATALPVETMCWSLPSMFMMKIWSHFTSPCADW